MNALTFLSHDLLLYVIVIIVIFKLAGPHSANACRPPSAPCGVGAGPTSWTTLPTWQPLDGRALPTRRTSPASRRPPRMGTRHSIPLLPTGKPLRGTTPMMMIIVNTTEQSFTSDSSV